MDRYRDRANDRLILRQITDEVMFEIRNLSGQDYVDTYATKQHESIPSEPSENVLPHLTEEPPAEEPSEPSVGEPRSSADVLQPRPLVDLTL